MHPSVGYQQATEIREGLDRNFLLILSDAGAKGGGGALATFNRSIGPFQADRTEVTFVRSLVIVDPAATGRAGTAGVYRSPFSLPNGEILASYAANVDRPGRRHAKVRPGRGRTMEPARAGRWSATGRCPTSRRRWATSAPSAQLFQNLPQLVFGGHSGQNSGSSGTMHLPDAPVLATLLGANLRRGRNVAPMDAARALRVYQENAPPAPCRDRRTRTAP